MNFQIIQPIDALKPYIYRYVFVKADGSTDTMTPPPDDPRFVNGKHVQPFLPNYGSMVFIRNVVVEVCGKISDSLLLLGANQKTIGITTLSGWFEGMLVDFEPGGMHALLGISLQQLSGRVLNVKEYGDTGLQQCDLLYKTTYDVRDVARLLDAFFVGHLPCKEDINYHRLRQVVNACDVYKGNITAVDMASVACLGERQFLRIFRKYVGMSPKQFIRLRRFHRALQSMQQQSHANIDLMSIALQHGYYDLSHMALDFRRMGCVSPAHFRMLGIPLTDDFSVFFA